MKEFDYIIIGGGCAGLSLAYELEIHNKLENKTLAIIEPRDEYKRDKTWSFWRVSEHNFDDCVIKNWKNFSVNAPNKTNFLECENYPYQSIDSGLFYEKINNSLKKNKNIFFLKELKDINTKNSFIFNSVPSIKKDFRNLWQHFCGVEIETENNYFDENIFNLMDFDCDQRESVHFFYTLPFSKKKALIESTWLSKMNDDSQKDYDQQIKEYIEKKLNLKNYKITYKEIFLRVLEKHPKRMSEIFFKMFQSSPKTIIKFLSNKSNFLEDLTIILKMPKWIFIKALFY